METQISSLIIKMEKRINEEFKKNEGLAQLVIDLLINDYFNRDKSLSKLNDKEYKSLINWSIIDYESCGFDMSMYRIYSGILNKQEEGKNGKEID